MPHEPASPFRGIDPREASTYVNQNTCMWTCIAALFKIVTSKQTSKQLRCQSWAEWKMKLWRIHPMETLQQRKATNTLWVNLIDTLPADKIVHFMLPFIQSSKITESSCKGSEVRRAVLFEEKEDVSRGAVPEEYLGLVSCLLLWVMIQWHIITLWKFSELVLRTCALVCMWFCFNRQF